jgi:hypothetical protein
LKLKPSTFLLWQTLTSHMGTTGTTGYTEYQVGGGWVSSGQGYTTRWGV